MATTSDNGLGALKQAVQRMTRACAEVSSETDLIAQGQGVMRALIASDDWLPDAFAQPHPEFYCQYLLHADPLGRFSIVSFVWGPGQQTPIHDHTVWGIIGMLRGGEFSQRFAADGSGPLKPGAEERLNPGDVEVVSPTVGDIHRVRNAFADQVSISIHLYGANIGEVERHVFDPITGKIKPFISGYSNTVVPNLWGPAAA